jgi:hypothetical protein
MPQWPGGPEALSQSARVLDFGSRDCARRNDDSCLKLEDIIMTFQIARSVINGLGYDYAAAVEAFRQAKLEHRFTGDIAPSAPAIIEHAVTRVPIPGQADDFVADFNVLEDIPVPTLAERKQALIGTIRAMEAAALARIISPARERLMGLDINAVYVKPEAERTDADLALLARMSQLAARKEVVYRHSANLEVAVEELTDATIDGWTPAEFPR